MGPQGLKGSLIAQFSFRGLLFYSVRTSVIDLAIGRLGL
jgi:hypothetical protein